MKPSITTTLDVFKKLREVDPQGTVANSIPAFEHEAHIFPSRAERSFGEKRDQIQESVTQCGLTNCVPS